MNRVILIGNLTKDVEVRSTPLIHIMSQSSALFRDKFLRFSDNKAPPPSARPRFFSRMPGLFLQCKVLPAYAGRRNKPRCPRQKSSHRPRDNNPTGALGPF